MLYQTLFLRNSVFCLLSFFPKDPKFQTMILAKIHYFTLEVHL